MRKIMFVTPIIASAALVLLTAGPASAQTDTSFEVAAGTLAVADPASVVLPGVTARVGTQTVSGPLGEVSVTDNRGGTAAWAAQVSSTAFTGPNSTSVPATAVSYSAPAPTSTGTVTLTAAASPDLSVAAAVVSASAVSGANTAAWNPTITITVPGGALAGAYTGTITHSVA
ncbi:WxL domain-containing protein (plasmid) [Pseudonocardia bannensis]|uniref:WxL domain-containing protein n=1 Tax=Pseudonocardia bannensis TaxID=630973 RepID=A0A848DQA8_9PSEU|nr:MULTISPECIES: WxL domain-containing protein [Pseudonocardia]NMH94982.1 hypothetical protein [Pseudonocardia bannensis]